MPGDHSVHLSLSIPTAVNNRSAHLDLGVTVEPLLAQHAYKRGEEGSGQTRVKNGLDANDGGIGAAPFGKSGIGTTWDIPKRGTGDDPEESMVHSLVIRLELALHIENESGRDSGKQTGLSPRKNAKLTRQSRCPWKSTHED